MDQHNGGELPPEQQPPIVFPDDPGGGLPANVEPPMPRALASGGGGQKPPPPPPPPDDDEGDEEDRGMLRMSFMDHLQELRTRIIRSLMGFGVAFLVGIIFATDLWNVIRAPGQAAFDNLGKGGFVAIDPMEQFSIIWMWAPLVAACFIAAPWVIYQVWAFISPGLYARERKWAI